MHIKKSLLFLSALFIIISSGCGEEESGPIIADRGEKENAKTEADLKRILVGGWKDENSKIAFMQDGSLYAEFTHMGLITGEGTWEVKGNKVYFNWERTNGPQTDEYQVLTYTDSTFSYQGTQEGDTTVFHAKKIR